MPLSCAHGVTAGAVPLKVHVACTAADAVETAKQELVAEKAEYKKAMEYAQKERVQAEDAKSSAAKAATEAVEAKNRSGSSAVERRNSPRADRNCNCGRLHWLRMTRVRRAIREKKEAIEAQEIAKVEKKQASDARAKALKEQAEARIAKDHAKNERSQAEAMRKEAEETTKKAKQATEEANAAKAAAEEQNKLLKKRIDALERLTAKQTEANAEAARQRDAFVKVQQRLTADKAQAMMMAAAHEKHIDALKSGVEYRERAAPPVAGVVVLVVKGCTSMIAADTNGKSDPYIKLRFGSEAACRPIPVNDPSWYGTKTIKNTRDPVYNEAFQFPVDPSFGAEGEQHPILCVVRDVNMGHQSAGGNSSWCPELESRTTHGCFHRQLAHSFPAPITRLQGLCAGV